MTARFVPPAAPELASAIERRTLTWDTFSQEL
jgi:hypothetical protein